MADTQGVARFPGVEQVRACEYVCQHGIAPGMATLTMRPQTNYPAAGGTLKFLYGDNAIELKGCKVASASMDVSGSGKFIKLAILDRRWKWAFGQISGNYNIRTDNNKVKPASKKTPHELVKLLSAAMGEDAFDVGDLPDDGYPEAAWDYAVPAQMLAQLVEELGCRIVYQPIADKFRICKPGEGVELPTTKVLSASGTIDPPEKPDKLVVVGARTRYQVDLLLEAVGIESDSAQTITPIDFLSYKPATGWGSDVLEFADIEDDKERELAKQSVFRYYRIAITADGIPVPGWEGGIIDKRERILPIESVLVETTGSDDEEKSIPAFPYGVWYPGDEDFGNGVTTMDPALGERSKVTRGYSLDTERGLVIFQEPIYQFDDNDNAVEATLRLRCAVSVRDQDTWQFPRVEVERDLGDFGTEPRYVRRDELQLEFVPTYNEQYAVAKLTDNREEVNKEAAKMLDAIEAEYKVEKPESAVYGGLLRIDPDGAIQEVAWSVGVDTPAQTRISRNKETSAKRIGYAERRLIEKQKARENAARLRSRREKKVKQEP